MESRQLFLDGHRIMNSMFREYLCARFFANMSKAVITLTSRIDKHRAWRQHAAANQKRTEKKRLDLNAHAGKPKPKSLLTLKETNVSTLHSLGCIACFLSSQTMRSPARTNKAPDRESSRYSNPSFSGSSSLCSCCCGRCVLHCNLALSCSY